MAEVAPALGSLTPKKRSHHDDDQLDTPDSYEQRATSTVSEAASTPLSSPKSGTASIIGTPALNGTSAALSNTPTTSTRPRKRRKLTVQEKEQIRLEKEAKEKARAEKKAQQELEKQAKEEEKRLKDEERRKKNEEKEEERREKELKKQEKELEKQKKEEEKLKEARKQQRLGSFFVVKPSKSSNASAPVPHSDISATKSDTADANTEVSGTPKETPQSTSDYQMTFLPFDLPSNTILAPMNPGIIYLKPGEDDKFEDVLTKTPGRDMSISLRNFFNLSNHSTDGVHHELRVRDIMDRLHGTSEQPLDVENPHPGLSPLELLHAVTVRTLKFHEDVRPPYHGTYTRIESPIEARRLARNPFCRRRPDTNYDYDSEAEWEEPEEGEDIDSDGEEDAEELDDDEDMEGFLDDEGEEGLNKRKIVNSDLEPVCSGLHWEDAKGKYIDTAESELNAESHQYCIGFLTDAPIRTIDPFSTSYWGEPALVVPMPTSGGDMGPPRMPLAARHNNGLLTGNKPMDPTVKKGPGRPPKTASTGPKRLVGAEELPAFKAAIQGSDLTKIGLIEDLKRKFPKLPKDVIKDTLGTIAARVGAKEADKRWVVLDK